MPTGQPSLRRRAAAAGLLAALLAVSGLTLAAGPAVAYQDPTQDPAGSVAADRDESGLALLIPPDRDGIVAEIGKAVSASGRFHLLPAHAITIKAQMPLLEPEPHVTLRRRNAWLQQTQAHWLVFGTVGKQQERVGDPNGNGQIATTSYDVALRVFDLDLGDTGPLFTGSSADPAAVAQEAVRFLRAQYPLHALVTAIHGDSIYLDVGKQDGIDPGSVFLVERHPGPYGEQVATLQVTSAADWFSECEVEDQYKGRNPQVGDVAIEDTSSFLSTGP